VKEGKAELRFPKSAKKTKVTQITSGSGDEADPLYEFVEVTSA
jgi:hypothetical protein